ncbi:MAG: L-threonylcarbamoyladenylate synthase [Spirochaetaceae bacterium]|nr:L-threonylcarbamoyladenylate synthase [Spirochaetaceae bacterium]
MIDSTPRIISREEAFSEKIVAECILKGGVCVIPTDTVYGFSGIVPWSKNKIQTIKGRDEGKPFIQLIADPNEIYNYTSFSIPSRLFSLWPGALTLVVPVSKGDNAGSTIAFRCPGDAWLRKVVELVGSPIYSTSVNRSGQPVMYKLQSICDEFLGEVDLVVDGDKIIAPDAKASTLVELTDDGQCKVLRQGSVTIPSELLT